MKKSLGQHFLRQVPKEILFPIDALEAIQSLQTTAYIHILEIGPGNGVVTEQVIKQIQVFSKLLFTYEVVDVDLEAIQATRERLQNMDLPKRIKTQFTHSDILKHSLKPDNKADFVYIFGSLPYNISKKIVNWNIQQYAKLNPIIRTLPSRFIIQKEVAEDYVSKPPHAAFLGTAMSLYANQRKITKNLPPGSFYPPPKVDSSILEVEWRNDLSKIYTQNEIIIKTIRHGYQAKRKKIGALLKYKIPASAKNPTLEHLLHMRAHEVSTAEWLLIHQAVTS